MSDIVILHDSFDTIGGAEHVATTMAKIFHAPIYTTTKTTNFYDDRVQIIPLIKQGKVDNYALNQLRSARTFKKLTHDSDVILSSGDNVKFFKPDNNQKHINYTYTPPRMLYDLKEVYKLRFKFPKSVLFELFSLYQRRNINIALNNIDILLCLSEVVRDRIRKYWNMESKIVYPPIETSKYRYAESEGYFLYVSRLSRIKRTDMVLDVFDNINEKLVVVGNDEEGFERRMKGMKNVDYKGQISEDKKIDLLAHCEAVIYPSMEEDFGIVPIEAFAGGKPVIGVCEGFTKYQINSKTGIFALPTIKDMKKAIIELKKSDWNSTEIRKHAKRYDISVFERELKSVVGSIK